MGVFSWNDCATKNSKSIMLGTGPVYVLIPQEFGGGHILEPCYQGYGNFGGHDIFEVVADWHKGLYHDFNRFEKPSPRENYGGFYSFEIQAMLEQGMTEDEIKAKEQAKIEENYQRGLARYEANKQIFYDFMNGLTDDELANKYPNYSKRDVGIMIASDEKNLTLKFPIKLTYDASAVYEDCCASTSADNQGCY